MKTKFLAYKVLSDKIIDVPDEMEIREIHKGKQKKKTQKKRMGRIKKLFSFFFHTMEIMPERSKSKKRAEEKPQQASIVALSREMKDKAESLASCIYEY